MSESVDLNALLSGLKNKCRVSLARSITLVESELPTHRVLARKLLNQILKVKPNSRSVAISGPPGVGKSTFICELTKKLHAKGKSIGILTIDPSSPLSGGSLLGDKTRMGEISSLECVFIRPTPNSGYGGGISPRCREALMVLRAFEFDFVLLETVGVGQSEYLANEMVDVFITLELPHSGDSLQAIKRGILELSDMVLIHKADGELFEYARKARSQYEGALHISRKNPPSVFCVSSKTGEGLDQTVESLFSKFKTLETSGELEKKRAKQEVLWFREMFFSELEEKANAHLENQGDLVFKIQKGEMTPFEACERCLEVMFGK